MTSLQSPNGAAITDHEPRCWRCGRMLAYYVSRPWKLQCNRCRATNGSEPHVVPVDEQERTVLR